MSLVDPTKYNGVSLDFIVEPVSSPHNLSQASGTATIQQAVHAALLSPPDSPRLSSVKVASAGPTVTIMPQESPLLTAKEVQAYLRISRSTLYRLLGRGELVSHKVGSAHRFYLHDVQEYIKGK